MNLSIDYDNCASMWCRLLHICRWEYLHAALVQYLCDECGSVNCFIIVGESTTTATLTATKDWKETIPALFLQEVNHRIFGPSQKSYRQQSWWQQCCGKGGGGGFFFWLYVQFVITHSHIIRFMPQVAVHSTGESGRQGNANREWWSRGS